jgi:hypothetical protein
VYTIRRRTVVLGAALAFLGSAARSEQPQKAARPVQEDRIKKLEERVDAAEKAASVAAMERDYIARTQKQYESYYEKVLRTEMWTLGIMGLILAAVSGFAVRFSLNTINERAKMAMAEATTQTRNEFARTGAKEVQKLWDSNAADIKKLKEGLTTQIAELEKNLKDRSEFQFQFVQGLAGSIDLRPGDSVVAFRNALRTYKSGKSRKLIETRFGATTARYIFELLRKEHGEKYVEKTREELADPLYDQLEEELAAAALQSPWITPLINERKPVLPEPPTQEPTVAVRPAAPTPVVLSAEADLAIDVESEARLVDSQ